MRLIDADAFDERVRAAGGMSEEELSEDFKDGVLAVLYMMSKQPTITAQPEKRTEERTETHACDCVSRQAVQEIVDRIGGMYPYRQIGNRDSYSQYNEAWTDAINRVGAELNSLPSAQSTMGQQNDGDTISRQDAIDEIEITSFDDYGDYIRVRELIEQLPPAQPEIIHCGECIYYDPPHVEKEDARYEYSEMPKEAFDVLGTGLVSMEYGINIGGRCCVDYYCKSYSDDKRVYVREDNYCGRAERRTDG